MYNSACIIQRSAYLCCCLTAHREKIKLPARMETEANLMSTEIHLNFWKIQAHNLKFKFNQN